MRVDFNFSNDLQLFRQNKNMEIQREVMQCTVNDQQLIKTE